MRTEVLKLAAQRNKFLSPDALEIILSDPEPRTFLSNILSAISADTLFIEKNDIVGFLSKNLSEKEIKPVVPKNKRQYDISVIDGTDITGESTCEGSVDDFTRYFLSRYNLIRDIVKRKIGAVMPIETVSSTRWESMDREVRVIGMVSNVTTTKNGHKMLELEDESGSCKVIVMKDKPLINDIIVNDEVIGLIGSPMSKGTLIATDIVRPGVSADPWENSDSVASVAFLSDIHVGSHTFLESRWNNMIKWLRENAKKTDLDYLILPGDVVDGIGIFPGQQEELLIDDIYKQYGKLAERLKDIPDHIKIVLQPGNHDAVRPAEPQPALPKAFAEYFDSNIMLTANPVSLNIEGRNVLTYHGRSIDDWVKSVQQLTYNDPVRIMKEMLERRHLAPMYGLKTALAPEKKDYLVINKKPDIFVTGHVHGAGSVEYKGIRLIAASTWQDQTEYQRMHNFNPEPGVMPIVHLGTGDTVMKHF